MYQQFVYVYHEDQADHHRGSGPGSRAKRYARRQGVSLSALIESALRDMTGAEKRTFTEKWIGQFELADRDDPRYKALLEKYG